MADRLVGSVCVVLSLGLAGCFAYELAPAPPPAGKEVAVELTSSGSADLADAIGAHATAIRGRLIDTTGGVVSMAVDAVEVRDGDDLQWNGEVVNIPRGAVAQFRERKFSFGRTVLLGGAVAGVTVLAYQVGGGINEGTNVGGGGKGGQGR